MFLQLIYIVYYNNAFQHNTLIKDESKTARTLIQALSVKCLDFIKKPNDG